MGNRLVLPDGTVVGEIPDGVPPPTVLPDGNPIPKGARLEPLTTPFGTIGQMPPSQPAQPSGSELDKVVPELTAWTLQVGAIPFTGGASLNKTGPLSGALRAGGRQIGQALAGQPSVFTGQPFSDTKQQIRTDFMAGMGSEVVGQGSGKLAEWGLKAGGKLTQLLGGLPGTVGRTVDSLTNIVGGKLRSKAGLIFDRIEEKVGAGTMVPVSDDLAALLEAAKDKAKRAVFGRMGNPGLASDLVDAATKMRRAAGPQRVEQILLDRSGPVGYTVPSLGQKFQSMQEALDALAKQHGVPFAHVKTTADPFVQEAVFPGAAGKAEIPFEVLNNLSSKTGTFGNYGKLGLAERRMADALKKSVGDSYRGLGDYNGINVGKAYDEAWELYRRVYQVGGAGAQGAALGFFFGPAWSGGEKPTWSDKSKNAFMGAVGGALYGAMPPGARQGAARIGGTIGANLPWAFGGREYVLSEGPIDLKGELGEQKKRGAR